MGERSPRASWHRRGRSRTAMRTAASSSVRPGRRPRRCAPRRRQYWGCRRPSADGEGVHRAGRVAPMTESVRALDVVVRGGGGHVGLPLSLSLAQAGARVGIFDTNPDTIATIGRGEMPFLETGADELLREVLATGR